MITRAFDPLDPSSVINKREGGKVMVVVSRGASIHASHETGNFV